MVMNALVFTAFGAGVYWLMRHDGHPPRSAAVLAVGAVATAFAIGFLFATAIAQTLSVTTDAG